MAAADTAMANGIATMNLEEKPILAEKVELTSNGIETRPFINSLRADTSVPRKTPIVDPTESSKPAKAAELCPDQQAKYEEVLKTVTGWKEIPASGGKGGPIKHDEIMFLTRECILRYLRATKWHTAEASKRLLGTLTWRREYGVWDISEDDSSIENETGKLIIAGFDNEARPCMYMEPGRQNTAVSPRQIRHLVFMLEHAIDLCGPGQESLSLIINYKPSKTRSNTAPGLAQGRETLHILQTHYPERLGKGFNVNMHWFVNGFFKLITPFIDPITRKKLHFNESMQPYVPPEQLMTEYKGELEFIYEHQTYWPALLGLRKDRLAEKQMRWVSAGKHYGESEYYLHGGNAPSIGQKPTTDVQASQDEKIDSPSQPAKQETLKENVPVTQKPLQTEGTSVDGGVDGAAKATDPLPLTKEVEA